MMINTSCSHKEKKMKLIRFVIMLTILIGLSLSTAIAQEKQTEEKKADMPRVRLETSLGNIVVELNPTAAPNTVENYLTYVKDGFYNGTIFHRVIKGFMIQGGGFTSDLQQKPTRPAIQNEADNGLKNLRGTIAMARTPDPNSATAQFFINTVDNAFLNFTAKTPRGWGYCVFGKVVEGMDVVDAIEKQPTTTKNIGGDVPVTPVIINKAVVVEKK
jgi:peptidyl-prolyl cis-trans isomerase B (cyclophilin B)